VPSQKGLLVPIILGQGLQCAITQLAHPTYDEVALLDIIPRQINVRYVMLRKTLYMATNLTLEMHVLMPVLVLGAVVVTQPEACMA
jgi:hypothetical protein